MPQRILIVEPEPHAREGLRALLAAAGHEVSVAEDLDAGFVARLSSGPFDLLILDADLTGRGVVRTVLDLLRLARIGHQETRGILVTSCAEELPQNLASHGVVTVLERPVELSRLRRVLEAAETGSGRRTEASRAPGR